MVAVMASETTEVPRRSSRRADTACAVPLVKAKYFTCVDPPATDPKSTPRRPRREFRNLRRDQHARALASLRRGRGLRGVLRARPAARGGGADPPPPPAAVGSAGAYETGIFGFAQGCAPTTRPDRARQPSPRRRLGRRRGRSTKARPRGEARVPGRSRFSSRMRPEPAPPLGFLRSCRVRNPRRVRGVIRRRVRRANTPSGNSGCTPRPSRCKPPCAPPRPA